MDHAGAHHSPADYIFCFLVTLFYFQMVKNREKKKKRKKTLKELCPFCMVNDNRKSKLKQKEPFFFCLFCFLFYFSFFAILALNTMHLFILAKAKILRFYLSTLFTRNFQTRI